MKDRLILAAAIVIGILAFVLTHQYLKSERDKLYAGAAKVKILAAGQDLPAGTVREFSDLAQKSVYKAAGGAKICIFNPHHTIKSYGQRTA